MEKDDKLDDGILTPKKLKEVDPRKVTNEKPIIPRVDKYPNQTHNLISSYPIE
jgi:hypothetical protein